MSTFSLHLRLSWLPGVFVLFLAALPLFAAPPSEIETLRAAAEKGDPVAQKNLGNCYYAGDGVPKDYGKAIYWYRKSAAQGYPNAQNNLGNCCFHGQGVKKDLVEAVKWYRMAAKQGLAAAQYNLGNCYFHGQGVKKDLVEAAKWYRMAAEQGDSDAQNELGNCYYNGNGVDKDYAEAVKWYHKAAAQGLATAQCMLGWCYEDGNGVPKDYKQAVYWCHKAAEQGNAEAQYNLGVFYYYGKGVVQNYEMAVNWYSRAAEQGLKWSQYALGLCYYKGNGVPKDHKQAVCWYRKAAERGVALAQFNLALCYDMGEGVSKDSTEAVKWYRKAAEQGLALAQQNLGGCYLDGTGVQRDHYEAVKWYCKAAEQGEALAQNQLGNFYFKGEGVSKDSTEAVKWYRKAAEQGYALAQYNLAQRYANGEGVEKNYKQAAYWYCKAAEQGFAWAQNNLGSYYYNGEDIEKDYKQAVYWYRKAAEQGLAIAQYNLGLCYEKGNGVQQDQIKAVYWYRKAAEKGHTLAQCDLGWYYERGLGVEKNFKQAVYWYRKAATQGSAMAQNNLGACYCNGRGVEKDYKKAVPWFRKAAEQGLALAQNNLGLCYSNSDGVERDYKQAAYWYRKAAERGNSNAQKNLGLCYYRGKGVPMDYAEAVRWYRKSAEQGSADAQNNLGNCYRRGEGVSQNHTEAVKWYREAANQGYAYAQYNLALCYENGWGVSRDHAEALKWHQKAVGQSDALLQYSLSNRYTESVAAMSVADQNGNSYYQLRMILDDIRGGDCDFDGMEAKLNSVVPRECLVGKMIVTADEIKFLILAYKLDYGTNAGKKDKVKQYLSELESLLSTARIDFKKLAGLFTGLDFAALTVDVGMLRGYLLVQPSAAVVERIQTALKKYEKGSLEYVLLTYELGRAYTKIGKIELASEPLEYAFKELEKRSMTVHVERVASDLSVVAAYGMLSGRSEESVKIVGMISASGSDERDPYHQAMLKFSRAIYLQPSEWNADAKREFENNRSIVLGNASDDVQSFIAYAISAVVRSEHDYPAEEVLPDLEQAFLYRAMLWGDTNAENAEYGKLLKQIDERLNELKEKLLQYLTESGKSDRFAYWNAKFELARHRRAALDAASAEHKELQPLLAMVNRYLNAEQILTYERAKKPEDQDKRRIRTALKIKRELERQFEVERKKLSPDELKIFDAFLSDQFVIHPGFMVQWSRILPQETACVQFLPLKGKVLVFIVVNNAPPFTVTIDLKNKGCSQRQFIAKLVRARNLLSFNAAPEATQQALTELYKLLFSDLEEPLAKLKTTKLIVNASGILRYIPFAALYDGKRYLVEKYQVTNVTGLDLVRLATSTNTRQFGSMRAAVFADPDGSLPSGRSEGKSIAGLFANSRLFVGNQASFDEFESMIGEVNFIHLATHAVLDPNNPQKSYIQFADGKKWYYSDMMGFNVENVDSIALSACSTAVSENSTSDGIEGMAFRLLGSSPSGSILASFWKVDDSATAMLMSIYYKHIVDSVKARNALDRGGALREAQLKLLRTPATSHPYYWAAFTLFGDFR